MIDESKIQSYIITFEKEYPNKKAIWNGKKTKLFLLYLQEKTGDNGNEFDWKCKNIIIIKPGKYARCSLWKLQIQGATGQECCYSNICKDKKVSKI